MSNEGVSQGRRKFLTGTMTVVGGLGAAGAAVPFIRMWEPSAKAKAAGAPVEVTVDKLEPGQLLQVEWRGQPVWIVNRTKPMLDALPVVRDRLQDPDSENEDQQPEYANNEYRSVKPEMLVLVGICTHLGCSPKFIPEMTAQPFDSDWKGGFFCPCHNSRFDLAGRVFQGVPAPANLKVPPHTYLDSSRLLIGVNPEGAA